MYIHHQEGAGVASQVDQRSERRRHPVRPGNVLNSVTRRGLLHAVVLRLPYKSKGPALDLALLRVL